MKTLIIISLTFTSLLQSMTNCEGITAYTKATYCTNLFYNKNSIHYSNESFYSKVQIATDQKFDTSKIKSNFIDSTNTTYHLKVRLTEVLPPMPDCGYIAFAIVQKFEIIQGNIPNYHNKFVLLVEPCSEFLGRNFFNMTDMYDVDITRTKVETTSYTCNNTYDKQLLPKFWIKKITKEN